MLISGIQPFTLLDYPNKTSCIVFVTGCNFRCGYCHNPEFVLPERLKLLQKDFINEDALFNFLLQRRELLDGVVISGGEPTLAPDLIPFMQKIRRLGFSIKLDTNGNRPEIISKALEERVVDYIAMDVKASLEGYRDLVGPLIRPDNIQKSIELIKNSSVHYEFRSTLLKEVHSAIMLEKMANLIKGARHWFLQKFRPENTLSPLFANYNSFSDQELADIAEHFRDRVNRISIR